MYSANDITEAVLARARADDDSAAQLHRAISSRSQSWLERLLGNVFQELGLNVARRLLTRASEILFGW